MSQTLIPIGQLDTNIATLSTVQTFSGNKTFSGQVTLGSVLNFNDAINVAVGSTTGTKIGLATTSKLGFFNATPVVQQSATADLGTVLSALGFRASGTAYPITTSGAVTLTGQLSAKVSASTSMVVGTGTYTDPATGVNYDAKFGGSGNGIAVAGASLFNSSVAVSSLKIGSTSVVGQVWTASDTAGNGGWANASGGGSMQTFDLPSYSGGASLGQQSWYGLITSDVTKTVTTAEIYLVAAQASSVIEVGIYSAAGTLLGSGTVTTTSSTGFYTVTFSSGISITTGTHYYIALLNRTNETVTRFARIASGNDINVTSGVSSVTALPGTQPAVGSRFSLADAYYVFIY